MPLQDYLEAMCVMNWVATPDGGGGFVWEWQDGAPFEGGIVLNSSTQMLIAQQTGTKSVYTLTVRKNVPLEKGDMVKRLSDDAIFKITSDPADRKTPAASELFCMSATMERVEA